jgi:PAS domain S-box-containing protein
MSDASILIVEDEAIIAEDLANRLRRLGYTVAGTTDRGEEALAMTQERRPSLVLMDIRLAGDMDGIEAAERLRAQCDAPVVYLTASSDQATINRAKVTEPYGFILKPFQDREMASHIEMALYRHQSECRLRESEQRYRMLFEGMTEGFALHEVITDAQGRVVDYRFLDVNPAFERLTGLQRADLLGKRLLEALPDTEAHWLERCGHVALTGEPSHFESRHASLGRWYEVRAYRPAPRQLALVLSDVSARKQAEEDLQRASCDLATTNATLLEQRRAAVNLMHDAVVAREEAERATTALRELHEQAEWLARFPRENPSPVLRIATDGQILHVNPAAAASGVWTGADGTLLAAPLRPLLQRSIATRAPIEEDVELGGKTYAVAVVVFPEEGYANLYGRDITDRKRAEAREREALALAAASQTAVEVLDAMGEGVVLLDLEGRIISINPAMEEMSGIPGGEANGRLVRDLFPGVLPAEDQGLAVKALAEAQDGRPPHLPSLTILRRGGGCVPVIPSVTFVRGTDGAPTEIVATFRDISALRAAQALLEESNALLERIFDNTHILIAYLNPDLTFARVNRSYAEADGRSPEFFVGKSHFELYPHAENEAIFRRVVESGEPFAVHGQPFAYPGHPERGTTYRDWTLTPVEGKAGPVVGLLLCLLDVTNQIQAQQALRESETKFRTLVERLPAVTYIAALDDANTTLYISPQIETMLGLSQQEYSAGSGLWRQHVHPADLGRVLKGLRRTHTTGVPFSAEYRMLTPDGREVWVVDDAVVVRDDAGNPASLQGVMFDVTRRRQAEVQLAAQRRELRALAAELVLAEERERRRLATELHDQAGQTLLVAKLKLQMLGQHVTGSAPTELHREALTLISQASDQIRTFTFELSPPILYKVGLGAALEWLAERFEQQYNVPAHCEVSGEWRGLSEQTKVFLFQSVRELLANAGKHAKAHNVRIRLAVEGGRVSVAVADDGVGFDPRAIESAGTAKRSFGLFSIRERTHHIGGSLSIVSEPGHGATFTLTAPAEARA